MTSIQLPDFEDMLFLAEKIGYLKGRELNLKNELNILMADITNTVTKDKNYFINGKPPSATHTKMTFHVVGYDDKTREELNNLNTQLADVIASLEKEMRTFQVYRDIIEVWKAEQYVKNQTTY